MNLEPLPPPDFARSDRRTFLKTLGGATAALAATPLLGTTRPAYNGPNIIVVRFGGGVRRLETIDPHGPGYAPYFRNKLIPQGTFYPRMEIDSFHNYNTSHGEGTLYILTGRYERFKDVGDKFLGARFESKVPTIFEYLRKEFDVPDHRTLIVNGEDRGDEEFYNFSNHHLFGANFRSNTLSLRRYKTYLLRERIAAGKWSGRELARKQADLVKKESLDLRQVEREGQGPALTRFWSEWREFYGETGLANPRGDRLLTELSLRALKQLRPRMMMINYNDPDYVHWGNMTHYTRAISVIDEGLERLVSAVESDPEYRDNTIFAIVPDCGRDTNPFAAVPCQHHFNSKSSHEIFALFLGKGIAKGVVVNRRVDQIQIASTIGKLAGMATPQAESTVLQEVFA